MSGNLVDTGLAVKNNIVSFDYKSLDPVPRLLFLRDVLLLPTGHPDVMEAKAGAMRSKWVTGILALQHEDGSFGYFHSLAGPTKRQPITTEQALRRLLALGLDINDEPPARSCFP